MRVIYIDLSSDKHWQQPKVFGGYAGEHNETVLQVKLPKRMVDIKCSGYRFDFQTSKNNKISSPLIPVSELKNDILSFRLIEQLTIAGKLLFNIVAVLLSENLNDNTASLLAKTNSVTLCIENSPEGTVQLIDPKACKDELQTIIDERVAKCLEDAGAVHFIPVTELPTENIDINAIYLLPSDNPEEENVFHEYLFSNGAWESIGGTGVAINLDEYVKNTDLATSEKAGLILGNGIYGARIMTNNPSHTNLAGRLAGITRNAEQYKDLHSEFFICKGTLDAIKNQYIKEGITANTETLTDEEKAAALKWLGLDDIGVGGNKYIIFDTPTKKQYSSNYWARMVDERWGMNWSAVQNLQECKVGDTGILLGYNTTTKSNVMLLCEITGINEVDWLVETIPLACFQGLELGTGYMPLVQSHSIGGYHANFELKKGFVYLFTVHNSDNNSAKIVKSDGSTIRGVEGNALEGFKTGIVVCADRCTAVGLKDKLTVLNLTSFILNDRWDWETVGTCYLQTTSDDGIDIWEL